MTTIPQSRYYLVTVLNAAQLEACLKQVDAVYLYTHFADGYWLRISKKQCRELLSLHGYNTENDLVIESDYDRQLWISFK